VKTAHTGRFWARGARRDASGKPRKTAGPFAPGDWYCQPGEPRWSARDAGLDQAGGSASVSV